MAIQIVTFAGQNGPIPLSQLDANFAAITNVINQRAPYSPTWGANGGAPSIGNGSIVGEWVRNANLVKASVNVTFGSTTTYGSGAWTFSLPFATAGALNSYGTAFFGATGGGSLTVGVAALLIGNSNFVNIEANGVAFVGSATLGWASTGFLNFSIAYEIAA